MELLEGFSHYLCRITIDYICSTPYLYVKNIEVRNGMIHIPISTEIMEEN